MKNILFCGLLLCCLSITPSAHSQSAAEAEKNRAIEISNDLKAIYESGNSTPEAWDAVRLKIDNYQKDFGVTPQTSNNVMVLRKMELAVAKKMGDSSRYAALLTQLSTDSIPEIAAMAKELLAAQQKITDLKSKPMELQFTAVDGSAVDLAKLRGKVVLLDFWATWCPPCVEGVPEVVATYKKYHDQGFEIVGISLDKDKDTMLAFTAKNGMVWPQYFDGQGWDNTVSKGYDIHFIPALWLIDKKGLLSTTNGRSDLAGQVEKLLAAP